ncbi:DUF4230 domain-containing protein [uncultured Porphyromonas sp.]|uniref:DUF4230 domain-containing protein n=1 Tax=uncultured Porphyromonas sp. TaxID=159274 RepID=UPI00262E1252|nr:DUF4230 domain-containing protein [uncultured Porphyromonas sp.]
MSKQSKGLYAIVLIGIALLIIGGVLVLRGERAKERTRLSHLYDTVITDITDVLRVTVLESEEVVPVNYRTGRTEAFGVGHYRTRIYFDVEQLAAVQHGDTLFVRLPQPEVAILEDETRGFVLVDVWSRDLGTNLIGPRLSTQQENAMRLRAVEEARRRVSSAENLSRARSEAGAVLADMLSIVPGTVIVYTSPFDALPDDPDRVLMPKKK